MNCGQKEKSILLFYGELTGEQAERARLHISSCPQCAQTIKTLEKLSEAASFDLPEILERKTLEKVFYSPSGFSWKEKILALGFSFAAAFLFIIPKTPQKIYAPSESDFSSVENEISALKYDMADYSDSASEYFLYSFADIKEENIKEEV
ncbi:MAG: hypothetical protein GX447_02800 [Elusimicrobia bacterium]|nr:hypothetical protein [Elusimicrobiota bacterium]